MQHTDLNTDIVLATLVVYQLALIAIGFWARGRTRSSDEFFLAGRSMGPWVAALSYAASSSSAWVLLGLTGFFYSTGPVGLWVLPGVWAGYAVVWLFLGPALRRITGEHDLVTIPDFLSLGLEPASARRVRLLAALMILFCFSFYVASQFQGAGNAFAETFNMPKLWAVLLGAAVVLIYTWFGGFWAVSLTDALQAGLIVLISVTLAILAVLALPQGTSLFAPVATISHPSPHGIALIGFIMGSLGIGIGPVGQPQLLTRVMALKSGNDIRRAFTVAIVWSVLVFSAMAVLGLAARHLVAGASGAESVFFTLSHHLLPPALAGMVLAAVLSAIMSTADSLLLAAGSAAAHDTGLTRSHPKSALMISRLATLGVSLAALALTLLLPASIYSRVLFAWSALGAAFGPVVVLNVMGRRLSEARLHFLMLAGFGLTIWFYLLPNAPGDWLERVLPFFLVLVAGLVFSRKA